MPDPKNPGQRVKAHRLRQAVANGQTLPPVDQLWLAEYEGEDARRRHQLSGGKDVGASRSARTIKLDIDEQAETIGTGAAAVAAASAALVAKEEGRRLDGLTLGAIEALKASADINRQTALMLREDYGAIFESLRARTEVLEQTHIEMLLSVRAHFLAATEAEGALIQRDKDQDPATELVMMLLAKQLGLPVDQVSAAAAAAAAKVKPQQKRPPPNGAAA